MTLPFTLQHFFQIEMAHKVLSSDMAELINAMRLAQQYSTTLLDGDYRKGMLKAAHVLAMDSKNLLDAVGKCPEDKLRVVGMLKMHHRAGGMGGRATPPLYTPPPYSHHRRTPSGGSIQYTLTTSSDRTHTALHTTPINSQNPLGQSVRPPGGPQFPTEHNSASDC